MADLKKLDSIAIESTPEEVAFRAKRKAASAQRKYNVHVALRLLQYIDDTPNMNQTQLAKLLGMSSAYLSRVINGKENLSLNTVAEYENRLGGYSLLPTSQEPVIVLETKPKVEILGASSVFSAILHSSKSYKKDSTYVSSEANFVFA